MNQAMFAKSSWRITQGDHGLRCKIFESKYLQHNSILTWSSVFHGAKLLRSGIIWRVGTGSSINFWRDNWTGFGALASLATDINLVDIDASVHHFVHNSRWNVELLMLAFLVRLLITYLWTPLAPLLILKIGLFGRIALMASSLLAVAMLARSLLAFF